MRPGDCRTVHADFGDFLLSAYEALATFAFVMALPLKEDELDKSMPRLSDAQVDGSTG